jgi:hypothetical protein
MSGVLDYHPCRIEFLPMKKSQKQFLSVLFHLAVLACMVAVYDAGQLVVGKYKASQSENKKTEDETKGKGNAGMPTGGTTMADLMKEKAKKQAEKKGGTEKEKAAEAKNEKTEDKAKGKANAIAPAGGTTMADLMKERAKRQAEKKTEIQAQN